MENILLTSYMNPFKALSLESRLELLAQLTESIKTEVSLKSSTQKGELLDELFGAWADTDEGMTAKIYESRTSSDRTFTFD